MLSEGFPLHQFIIKKHLQMVAKYNISLKCSSKKCSKKIFCRQGRQRNVSGHHDKMDHTKQTQFAKKEIYRTRIIEHETIIHNNFKGTNLPIYFKQYVPHILLILYSMLVIK